MAVGVEHFKVCCPLNQNIDDSNAAFTNPLLVAVRKRAFLATAGCKDTRNELAALVHPIPSSSDTNAGLSTAAADAPHRQGRSPRWITRVLRMVSRRFLTAIF